MRSVAGHLAAWAVCLMLGLAIGEIAGAIMFYHQQDRLVYFNTRMTTTIASQDEQGQRQYSQRLHPYLGFGGPYDLVSQTWETNNLGFPQRTDLRVPFATRGNDLAVFVFGGSVASNLVTPPQGGTSLARALQEKLPDRNIIVYSMAQGSGKQPQQVMALAMVLAMGQRIDVVVNLDGFNELALGYANQFHRVQPIFPSISIMWGIANTLASDGKMTADFYRTAADIIEAKNMIARRNEGAANSRFGLKYLYHKVIISYYLRRKAAAEANYVGGIKDVPEDLERAKHLTGMDIPVDASVDASKASFDIWLQSSELMSAMARSANAKYVHVIQPNQYASRKHFSPEEERIARSMPSTQPMRIGAERGYPLIEKHADLIAGHGIVSGLSIFDGETVPMYVDNCCHFTRAGEDVLANFVAEQVVSQLR